MEASETTPPQDAPVTAEKTGCMPGDIVFLISGGPPMTVIDFDSEVRIVHCRWFWKGRYHEQKFGAGELVVWTNPQDGFYRS